MSNFFHYENDIMNALTRVVDAFVLGLLWLVCSIPIVTMGASTTAFYYAYNKSVRQKRSYAWKSFFDGLKINLKQSTIIWFIFLGIGLLVILDYTILSPLVESFPVVTPFVGVFIAILIAVIMWGLVLFPYIGRFQNETKAILKNVAIIVIANFFKVILLFILFVIILALTLWLPVVGLFAPAMYMYMANMILEQIFRKYMTEEDLNREKEIEKIR